MVGGDFVFEVGHEAPEQLAQDNARISSRSHERSVGDGLFHLGHGGTVWKFSEGLDDRGQGEGHIGAGITVGYGVDIQVINYLFMAVQEPREALH